MAPGELQTTLFLLNSLAIGGAERKMVRLANSLVDRGAVIVIAYLCGPNTLRSEIDPRIKRVDLGRTGRFSLRALYTLIATIRSERVGTVVAVNLYPALYASLARLRLGAKRFRLAVSVNATGFRSRKESRQMILYRPLLARADMVIFGAESQRRLWRERYGTGARADSSVVLYNGVDVRRFAQSDEHTPTRAEVGLIARHVIGTVGQMRPEKAQVDFVRAIARLRERGLYVGGVIVGDGVERPRIVAEIEMLGLQQQIVLVGQARDVRPYLAMMDVFVLTSTGVETFSNAALEAMAAGIPVVTSSVGGMLELVSFGGGVTYEAGNVEELTQLIAEMLIDSEQRARMSEAARRSTLEHFDSERMVDDFQTLLGRLGTSTAVPPGP
jgi:glycosyltransferase involved in cell wall biosynthesis